MKLSLLGLIALTLFAQAIGPANFVARTGKVTLASAGTTATIQQPATNAETIQLSTAVVSCPASCVITQTQNAAAVTAGSGTAGTVSGTNPTPGATFALTFWTAVTLTGGTVVGAVPCSAACTVVLDLSPIKMGNTGTSTNYSVTISSVTGDAYIDFYGARQ